jgi:hypothetical protein
MGATTALILAILAASDAPCTTPCGLVIADVTNAECREYARTEAKFMSALHLFTEYGATTACTALRGILVTMHDDTWQDTKHGMVQGLTTCYPSRYTIDIVRGRQGAFAHEIFHILEGCKAHERWMARGRCTVIWWASGDFTC